MITRGTLIAVALAMGCLLLPGCGDDGEGMTPPATPTPTPPPGALVGPFITFFGMTRADDVLIPPASTTAAGVPVYVRPAGSGVRLVIEGTKGPSGADAGLSFYQEDLKSFPDLQIETSRALGDGSVRVCDPREMPGGVPAIDPPSFDATQTNINTVNDLACRFSDSPRTQDFDSCVKFPPTDEYHFVNATTTIQFCGFVNRFFEFPQGDTLVTVRLRDILGNPGPTSQLIFRVQP